MKFLYFLAVTMISLQSHSQSTQQNPFSRIVNSFESAPPIQPGVTFQTTIQSGICFSDRGDQFPLLFLLGYGSVQRGPAFPKQNLLKFGLDNEYGSQNPAETLKNRQAQLQNMIIQASAATLEEGSLVSRLNTEIWKLRFSSELVRGRSLPVVLQFDRRYKGGTLPMYACYFFN